jgi:hypothetical protein
VLALIQLGKTFYCAGASTGERGYLETANAFYVEAITMARADHQAQQVSTDTLALAQAGSAASILLLSRPGSDPSQTVRPLLCQALEGSTALSTAVPIAELLESILRTNHQVSVADGIAMALQLFHGEQVLNYTAGLRELRLLRHLAACQ